VRSLVSSRKINKLPEEKTLSMKTLVREGEGDTGWSRGQIGDWVKGDRAKKIRGGRWGSITLVSFVGTKTGYQSGTKESDFTEASREMFVVGGRRVRISSERQELT